jgi:hypothetical protein
MNGAFMLTVLCQTLVAGSRGSHKNADQDRVGDLSRLLPTSKPVKELDYQLSGWKMLSCSVTDMQVKEYVRFVRMKHRFAGPLLIVDRVRTTFSVIVGIGLLATGEVQSSPLHHCEPWPQCMDADTPSTGPTGPYTIGPYAPLQNALWQIAQEALRRSQENSTNGNALPPPAPLPPLAPLPPDALPKLTSRYVPDRPEQEEDPQAEQQRQLEKRLQEEQRQVEKQLQQEQQEEEEQQREIEGQQREIEGQQRGRQAAQRADEALRASGAGFLPEKDGWVGSDRDVYWDPSVQQINEMRKGETAARIAEQAEADVESLMSAAALMGGGTAGEPVLGEAAKRVGEVLEAAHLSQGLPPSDSMQPKVPPASDRSFLPPTWPADSEEVRGNGSTAKTHDPRK